MSKGQLAGLQIYGKKDDDTEDHSQDYVVKTKEEKMKSEKMKDGMDGFDEGQKKSGYRTLETVNPCAPAGNAGEYDYEPGTTTDDHDAPNKMDSAAQAKKEAKQKTVKSG